MVVLVVCVVVFIAAVLGILIFFRIWVTIAKMLLSFLPSSSSNVAGFALFSANPTTPTAQQSFFSASANYDYVCVVKHSRHPQ